ncbi:hypothetical protein [Halocola ammonii]
MKKASERATASDGFCMITSPYRVTAGNPHSKKNTPSLLEVEANEKGLKASDGF